MLLVFVVGLTTLVLSEGASLGGTARQSSRGRETNSLQLAATSNAAGGSSPHGDRSYFWMCPEVICAPVPRDCSLIEYIVYQYDYEVRGRLISVRCESCEYCLDGPSASVTSSLRHRRSARHGHGFDRPQPSCNVDCPQLPDQCQDERLTDIVINDIICKRCPACYDNTLISDDAGAL